MAGANGRRALRTIEVECPAWADGITRIREPRVRDFVEAQKIANDEERTIALLGAMVLDANGDPVGRDAILDASVGAMVELAAHVGPLTGDPSVPLDRTSDSATG